MNRKPTKVNILGTDITVSFKTQDEDPKLYNCDGYADPTSNAIVVRNYDDAKNEPMGLANTDAYINKVLRHECVHHFFSQSGLDCLSDNEEVVDWIAIQFPKMYKAFSELGCLN